MKLSKMFLAIIVTFICALAGCTPMQEQEKAMQQGSTSVTSVAQETIVNEPSLKLRMPETVIFSGGYDNSEWVVSSPDFCHLLINKDGKKEERCTLSDDQIELLNVAYDAVTDFSEKEQEYIVHDGTVVTIITNGNKYELMYGQAVQRELNQYVINLGNAIGWGNEQKLLFYQSARYDPREEWSLVEGWALQPDKAFFEDGGAIDVSVDIEDKSHMFLYLCNTDGLEYMYCRSDAVLPQVTDFEQIDKVVLELEGECFDVPQNVLSAVTDLLTDATAFSVSEDQVTTADVFWEGNLYVYYKKCMAYEYVACVQLTDTGKISVGFSNSAKDMLYFGDSESHVFLNGEAGEFFKKIVKK